ncbi:LrgB family protein [Sphingomonas koreensis]|uniref:LrgB family protein n=1 Tax=Tardiphaga sp. TaxID=1926292 RepID=UPI000F7D9220|nr:LrgB family protein [Sphingomonas koreensis]RSY03649.1 LrgB family protein [Sphingomonas koreensis]
MISATLLGLTATLGIFVVADYVSWASDRHPLAHPVLTATPILIVLLLATGTPYASYAASTCTLTFLLGPATVSLAIPIWRNRAIVRAALVPLLSALVAGGLTAVATVVGVAWSLGVPPDVLASLAPRSVTTPVAIEIAQGLGGSGSLATAAVLSSGVFGAIAYPVLFRLVGSRSSAANGFAAGVSAHGIGAAKAHQRQDVEGAFASLGMALNAVFTALFLGASYS